MFEALSTITIINTIKVINIIIIASAWSHHHYLYVALIFCEPMPESTSCIRRSMRFHLLTAARAIVTEGRRNRQDCSMARERSFWRVNDRAHQPSRDGEKMMDSYRTEVVALSWRRSMVSARCTWQIGEENKLWVRVNFLVPGKWLQIWEELEMRISALK
jgi:hypothetical protein